MSLRTRDFKVGMMARVVGLCTPKCPICTRWQSNLAQICEVVGSGIRASVWLKARNGRTRGFQGSQIEIVKGAARGKEVKDGQ